MISLWEESSDVATVPIVQEGIWRGCGRLGNLHGALPYPMGLGARVGTFGGSLGLRVHGECRQRLKTP